MKHKLALLAVLIMLLSGLAGLKAENASAEETPETLVVGSTTMLSGNFFSELWGNNVSDMDIRSLLHEYPLVSWTRMDEFQLNSTVVRSLDTKMEPDNAKTYVITLHQGLKYSDGTVISAADYVFSFLLFSSPQLAELTGLAVERKYVQGYQAYNSGSTKFFEGVRLLAEDMFSVTVKADNLPYYFELDYINSQPYPIRILAPGCEVADDGAGAYIKGPFTSEMLQQTILDPQTGYISHPAVSSGPYKLVDYDASMHVARMEINPFYSGNFERQKPSIEKITFVEVKNESAVADLRSGKVDLLNKMTDGKVIDAGLRFTLNRSLLAVPYLRSGSGFLAVSAERDATQSNLVRKAIAFSIDYSILPSLFLKGYGETIYGYYGLGQWMVKERGEELKALKRYDINLTIAADLLDEDGWTLNADGTSFRPGIDNLRYKELDGELKPLALVMAVTEKNTAADLLFNMLKENLAINGAALEKEELTLKDAFSKYYRQEERTFDLFFMGSNFSYLFNPENNFVAAQTHQGAFNTSGIRDSVLEQLARDMTRVNPGNTTGYLDRWLAFQAYWVEVLPMIPLYSNTYYDLFNPDLKDYEPQYHWNWGTAIVYARLRR